MSTVRHKQTLVRHCVVLLLAFTLLSGCNSAPSKTADRTSESPQNSVGVAKNSAGPDIDLNCVINHIQNPPESFHYSFKDVSDNPWQEEAEVTPQSIDGTFTNNSVPNPQSFHGTPQEVSPNLRAIGRIASLFAIVRSK